MASTEGQWAKISIHALHEESDLSATNHHHGGTIFQSTLSMRRATHRIADGIQIIIISIHALHEESDKAAGEQETHRQISIHALHEESDLVFFAASHGCQISIHALHEESDRPSHCQARSHSVDFNPRSP